MNRNIFDDCKQIFKNKNIFKLNEKNIKNIWMFMVQAMN